MYEVSLGSKADVDKAVAAAKRASRPFRRPPRGARRAAHKVIAVYKGRMKEIAAAISKEMGAPLRWRKGCRPAPASAIS